MATKRAFDDEDDAQHQPPPSSTKRAKHDQPASKQRRHQNAHMDPTWGQKYFFTGDLSSSVPRDSDLEFEDDTDAMAYLSSVRQQAGTIPHLLVAPKIGPQLPSSFQRTFNPDSDEEGEVSDHEDRSGYDNGIGDFRGYYWDGAYTAAPDEPEDYLSEGECAGEKEEDPSIAAAEAYFASIRSRFSALRSRLHISPPAHIVASLPKSHSPYVGPFGPRSTTFTQWKTRIENTDPFPAQVAAMDKDSILRVLRVIIGGTFLRVGMEVSERTSRWLWALLARLPNTGELSHTEIAWVRDLGRRAVLLGRSIAEMAALREELADGGGDLGLNDSVDDSDEDEDVAQEFEGEDKYSGDEESQVEGAVELDKGPPSGAVDVDEGLQASEKSVEAEEEKEDGTTDDQEEGEASEGEEDAPMELDSGAEDDDLEAAKSRLLAQLDRPDSPKPEGGDGDGQDSDEAMRARMNMRATINMILTVAGEFYGQRDLLEFRDPFAGM